MRTTIDIDDHLLDAVRELARSQRRSAGRVVSDLLRQALLGERGGASSVLLSTTGAVNRIRNQVLGA